MAKDPYKYFRIEARELADGLLQGVLELEKGSTAPEPVARMLRLAHTLKGAARVVKQSAIAEHAHTLEGLLSDRRTSAQAITHDEASRLFQLLDRIGAGLRALDPATVPTAPGAQRSDEAPAQESLETVRVDIRELDELLRSVSETTVQLGGARKALAEVEQLRDLARLLTEELAENASAATGALPRAQPLADELRDGLVRFGRALASQVDRLEGGLIEIQEASQRLRLVPARTVFAALDRAVRDAAQGLGKQVDFEAVGGEVQLDAQVLLLLRDALTHVVRNAVTHGIEAEAQRLSAGKPARGRVRLSVERQGRRVAFRCEDDGRGVDLEAVRAAAVARGSLQSAAADQLTPIELLDLLRAGGLTTSSSVTELSGRGVGLDVVRATAARLKGAFQIRSEPSRGATIEVQVPVSIASLQGLVVEVSGGAAVIPLDAVRQAVRVSDAEIARSATSQSIVHDGQVLPFLPLDRALQRASGVARRRQTWSAVVVRGANRQAAIGVDRVLGTASVVMRALPAEVAADPVIAGATLDAEGNPQLVLDPHGLIQAAERGLESQRDEPDATRLPLLVIDDSLTTRMLEQSILESAGYAVDVAVSAEEGLEKARARRYGLFVVDVEMPGMDGYEFVTQVRADAQLRDIPTILVTSRNAPEDRRRGEQVGARAYIGKGEFDQGLLLRTIRRLVG